MFSWIDGRVLLGNPAVFLKFTPQVFLFEVVVPALQAGVLSFKCNQVVFRNRLGYVF